LFDRRMREAGFAHAAIEQLLAKGAVAENGI